MKRRGLRFGPAARHLNDRERRRRLRLLRQARGGNVGALCILRELYHLRLPLVEAQLSCTLPWMRRNKKGRRRLRNAA